jgi:hypothetical protein
LARFAEIDDGRRMPAEDAIHARGCVVCGSTDARELSTTILADGAQVPVCGSHELSHRRARVAARTIQELRALTVDRRIQEDRRAPPGDELGLLLTEAFAPRRRRVSGRRSSE